MTESSNLYRRRISTTNPGCIVILLDQSESMSRDYGGQRKDVAAADAVNKVLWEILEASQDGAEYHDRCDVGVIGYGLSVGPIVGGKISRIRQQAEEITVAETQADGTDFELTKLRWVEPKAENTTPMAKAFNQAYDLIHPWSKINLDSFPPIVINITDGMPNDLQHGGDGKETQAAAQRLLKLATKYGTTLVFNAHIGEDATQEIILPNDEALLSDKYAKYLFQFSSEIPQPLFEFAVEAGFNPQIGARGMVYNAAAETLIKLLDFGSSQFH